MLIIILQKLPAIGYLFKPPFGKWRIYLKIEDYSMQSVYTAHIMQLDTLSIHYYILDMGCNHMYLIIDLCTFDFCNP